MTLGPSWVPDLQYEEHLISKVTAHEDGSYEIRRDNGWSFQVPPDSPIEPKPGMTARFYGQGLGSPVRGLFLDGVEIFYRTETEDEAYRQIQTYGRDAREWLERWDQGRSVWAIEMGGLGPGYEQAIHVAGAEVLRALIELDSDPDTWDVGTEAWEQVKEVMDQVGKRPEVDRLGLSGAQWGAARNHALCLYRQGPVGALTQPEIEDRKILVSKNFPGS